MITHHPKFELLQLFVNGELPASLSAGIAIHTDMCQQCQEKIAQLTEQMAEVSFEEGFLDQFIVDDEVVDFTDEAMLESLGINEMINNITESDDIATSIAPAEKSISYDAKEVFLPRALTNMSFGKTSNLGKLSRTRIQLNENEVHANLLEIKPGGSVPEHTHKGFELTVLLEGSFSDEHGEYVKGDFIMLDNSFQHHPRTKEGCLCYTVANDALHFTQGINKLLNPIGSLIY